MKKNEKIIEAVIEEKNKETKAYFFPRMLAYIIDIIIITIISSGIMFVLPKNENYDKYMNEYSKIQTDFIEEKITIDEFLNKSIDIVYDIDYSSVIPTILKITTLIVYFIIFQFYNKGQTLGKKLMKLKVVSTTGEELNINQVLYRALIIDSIAIDILVLGSLLFLGRRYYYYASSSLQVVSMIIIFVTLMMILFRKDGRGLHDVISKTKVVSIN